MRSNWRNEFIKWNYTNENDIDIITKTKDDIKYDECSVTIISYDLAVRKIDDLNGLVYDTIIVDESHFLKNRLTKRVKTLKNYLSKSSKQILLLSGTPATSCSRDLFSQLNILYPKYFDCYYDYTRRYCDGKNGAWGWDDRGSSNTSELNFILQHLIVRRLKRDILKDLPSKMRMKIFLDVKITAKMKKNEVKLDNLNQELRDVNIDDATPALEKKFKERLYLISQMFIQLSYTKKPAAIDYIKNTLENIGKEKLILFCHHVHVIDSIAETLEKIDIGFITIRGNTRQDIRQDLIDEFVDPASDKQVAILSLSACCTGLNITPVSKMIFVEILWDIATLKQSEDRIHRIGAEYTCEYYYLIGKNTIDERVFSNVSRKFSVLDKVLDNGADAHGFDFIS